MSPINFSTLAPEYQQLLALAKEKYGLDVVPLQELFGGRTGALLYLVSVTTGDLRRVEHLIVKFDRVSQRTKQTEVERHQSALREAPVLFAEQHMARLAYEVEAQGAIALFYTIAGQSLQRFRTLANQESQSKLDTLFSATDDYLLRDWNINSTFERALHPKILLEKWLGHRLKPDGPINSLLKDSFHVNPGIEGFIIQGQVYPNPWSYGLSVDQWEGAREIDVLTGFQHGDLNIANILAEFPENSDDLAGYFLIDFALYKSQTPLFYDQRYLEFSYLIRELERTSLQKWIDLVVHYSSQELPNPKEVPVDLAGACTVVNAGRKSFEDWIGETHPSMSDDLWGQFWLAGTAVGLNFCNKTSLSVEERMAALIYSAAHLKRFCMQFGVHQPREVNLLFDAKNTRDTEPGKIAIHVLAPQRKNLPVQPTPFLGRTTELQGTKDLLMQEGVHLMTLTGAGGTGKTRLALQVATDLQDKFADGVFFVDLAPVRDPESVFDTIARAISLRESGSRPLIETIKEQLQKQNMMLVLDNFEQVTAAAPKLAELTRSCPGLKVVVTSREALHVRDEQVFPVPPMSLPQANAKQMTIDQMAQSEAVQLFVERAKSVKPDFTLNTENAPTIVEICTRLDGLPLAIELATARISLFAPHDLLDRVGNRLKLLRGGARDLPERQQTLRGTINWSYELLSTGEQRLFAMLSIFSGFTVEAVEEVAEWIKHPDEVGIDILEGINSLLEKSLIRKASQGNGKSRLMMLETIREFAAERLEDEAEFCQAVHQGHATYFADFTQQHSRHLSENGRESIIERMEGDIENLRTSWNYWVSDGNLAQLRKLTDGLWVIYDARGWYQATVDLSQDLLKVLATTQSTPELTQEKIVLHTSLARALLAVKGYTPEVEKAYARALELSQASDEISDLFPVLRGLYSFYTLRGEFDKGLEVGKQILDLAERKHDNYIRMTGYLVLGSCMVFTGDTNQGLEYLEKGISCIDSDVRQSQHYQVGVYPGVSCCTTVALLLGGFGYPDRAIQRANKAIEVANKINHPYSLAYALFHNGYLRYWMREFEQTLEFAQAVMDYAEKHEFKIWTAVGACLRAACIAALGNPIEGLTLIQKGMDMYQGLNSPPIFWPLLRALQAQIYGLAGKAEQGLTFIDESIAIPMPGYGNVMLAEFYLVKGNLMLLCFPDKPAEAEKWFRQALDTAQVVKASTFELRAAINLTRLWMHTDKENSGRKILEEVYNKFTEGFTMPDLQEAQQLLGKM